MEIKKDLKKIEISKDMIIIILSVALLVVSAIAICSASFGGGRGDRDFGRERMMGRYQQYGKYANENNTNPNCTGAYNQNATTKPIQKSNTDTNNVPKAEPAI